MKLFGTDGIRDVFGRGNMTLETGRKFGMAMANFCQKRNLPLKIIIGRDTRKSGLALEEAVASGIVSMGGEAFLAGIIPTPAVSFLVQDQKAGAGIVISASHNPFEYNGLKPFKNNGTKLTDDEETEITNYISAYDLTELKKENFATGKKNILSDAKEKYANFLLTSLGDNLKAANLNLVLDCANGATYELAPIVFQKIANIDSVFINPNGKNINNNCGSQNLDGLKREVIGKNADLGLAFDGDGDRVIAVDEKGNALTGDQMIYVIAKMLKERGELKNDLVVTTVMSNLGFINDLKKMGIRHIATSVGDRPVFFEMRKNGGILGGEESGHIIFSNYLPTGDGIMAGVLLILAIKCFNKPLSELAQEIKLFPKILANVKVKNKPDLKTIPEIREIIREVENGLGGDGRILIRYSGTENLCRVMIEGKDENEVKKYINQIVQVVERNLS